MLDSLILASWIDDIFSTFSDATLYFSMAVVGTLLFSIRIILMMFFGLDDGGDFDLDVDMDTGGFDGHAGDFSLFSMVSVLSFMMGAGWLGLACRLEWGVGPVMSAIYAALFGFGLMLMSSMALWQMRKLNDPGGYDVNTCIGKTGRVYLTIPAKGSGRGQVQMTVDGRQKVMEAVSTGEEIESFATIRVVSIQGEETLVVERP